ncbi:hypothetical protein K432DRAFT_466797 [Lepidopterella palustris CBS 459.81]|uniref:Uncharacterized protein n=1 Tax=Lepidopterella palustris CBS 459.81 TaxID=1314670 RepID=A0A8E2E0N7_9PEZI|nr:hypothetical protein K432DRAFT_466797 [Lepidopterella palustris CBS 459.81]
MPMDCRVRELSNESSVHSYQFSHACNPREMPKFLYLAIVPLTYCTDQVSMHVLSALLFYYTLAGLLLRKNLGTRRRFYPILATTIATLEAVFVYCFLALNKPLIHQITFVSMCAITSVVLIYNMEQIESRRRKSRLRCMAGIGVVAFFGGHELWRLDFLTCASMRELRRNIGIPWAFVTKLHGCAYNYIEIIGRLSARDLEPKRFSLPLPKHFRTRPSYSILKPDISLQISPLMDLALDEEDSGIHTCP